MADLYVTSLPLGTMDNLIHCLIDRDTGSAFVVDPAWDYHAIAKHLSDHKAHIVGVLLTHTHYDHISALPELLTHHDVPVYVHEKEMTLGNLHLESVHCISDEDTISLGNQTIRVIETPGHTIGSVSFFCNDILIAGDTLFIDGCGRCNFPESDVDAMWHSLQRLKELPDETVIYVGHDYGQKERDSLVNQKRTNPYLLIEDKEFFIDFRMNLQSQYRSIPFAPSSREEMQHIQRSHQ